MVSVGRGSLFRIALSLLILIQDCGMDYSPAEELMGPTLKFARVCLEIFPKEILDKLFLTPPLFSPL